MSVTLMIVSFILASILPFHFEFPHTAPLLQVLYIVPDPDNKTPKDLLERSIREQKFMQDYYNRTGVHWRHFYGPHGPRPPPVLYMWPAKEIGEVHKVVSAEGYRYVRSAK